jgi:hypothetical protein
LGNLVVWTTAIIYLFLTLGSGYYAFLNQESTRLAVQR